MGKRDCSSRVWWFSLVVVLGVLSLSFVPSFELCGMNFSRVDLLSELRDHSLMGDAPVEYVADMERLDMELAAMSEIDTVVAADTLPEMPAERYEWIESLATRMPRRSISSADISFGSPEEVVAIEDFDSLAITRFDNFVEKLISGEDVRIAFMGDSFVEGDILTSDLRAELQNCFGGRGVGLVACDIPFNTVRKSVKRTSSGWSAYSVMNPKSAPATVKDRFFVSGYLAEGGVGATTRWQSTTAFETLDSCQRARVLLYSRDTSRVVVEINDSISREFEIAGADYLREIYVEAPIEALRLKVVDGKVLCYGASLEGASGVVVDNFSVRSNNGHAIFGTSATINRQADIFLGYDLVVLQYGLNIMQQGQRGYSRYRDQLCNMIAYAQRCFPDAAILVLGVSDRWVKSEESGSYVPIGSVDALTSYQRAAADSCGVAFWSTSQAMAKLGGMPAFVSNGWAAKDYTHINFLGGRRVAEELARAIKYEVHSRLVFDEQEAERKAQLEREIELEAQRLLQARIDIVLPMIDTVMSEGVTSDDLNVSEE